MIKPVPEDPIYESQLSSMTDLLIERCCFLSPILTEEVQPITVDPDSVLSDIGFDSLLVAELLISLLDSLAEVDPVGAERRSLPGDLLGVNTIHDLARVLVEKGWQ